MSSRSDHTCRDRVLDATETVIHRDGIGSFTLDAVAAEAGVSKGGLLHHFPSKERLIETLVARSIEQWACDCSRAIEAEVEGPGRVTRGLVNMCLGSPGHWSEQSRRSCAVLIAAISNNPALVLPMRANHRRMLEQLRQDGLPPGVSEAAVLALHGLWFEWLLGLEDLDPHRMSTLRSALERLLAQSGPNAATAERPGTKEKKQ